MQTKQQIQRLLAISGTAPNKRLGQNFLIDLNLMHLLIESAAIRNTDIVLEVGAGTGSFTEELVKYAGFVVSVEYDHILAQIVDRQLKDADNFKLINADVLESKSKINSDVINAIQQAQQQLSGRLMLVANLPYGIASPLMIDLIVGPTIADSMFITVQKEVAQRMVAQPGSGNYGLLSILMSAVGDAHIIRKLPPSVFWPKPQVDSAMVAFSRQEKKLQNIHDINVLKDVISMFLGHRRKMLKACVKFTPEKLAHIHNWDHIFEQSCVEPHCRPEELTAQNYISMANICAEVLR